MEIAFEHALSAYQGTIAFLREHSRKGHTPEWAKLQKILIQTGLSSLHSQAILASLIDAREIRDSHPLHIRILHLVERDILGTEAYGLLLDGLRFGLVDVLHVESLLEELAGQESLPISATALERTLARRWRYHLRNFAVH